MEIRGIGSNATNLKVLGMKYLLSTVHTVEKKVLLSHRVVVTISDAVYFQSELEAIYVCLYLYVREEHSLCDKSSKSC